jgi:hypothetical protein
MSKKKGKGPGTQVNEKGKESPKIGLYNAMYFGLKFFLMFMVKTSSGDPEFISLNSTDSRVRAIEGSSVSPNAGIFQKCISSIETALDYSSDNREDAAISTEESPTAAELYRLPAWQTSV